MPSRFLEAPDDRGGYHVWSTHTSAKKDSHSLRQTFALFYSCGEVKALHYTLAQYGSVVFESSKILEAIFVCFVAGACGQTPSRSEIIW